MSKIRFFLICVSPKQLKDVFKKLIKLIEVVEIHSCFGEYDLLAKVESVGYESIGEIVVNKINTIEGITDSQTLAATD